MNGAGAEPPDAAGRAAAWRAALRRYTVAIAARARSVPRPRRQPRGVYLRRAAVLVAVLGIALITWPFGQLAPGLSTDASWQLGLSLAVSKGLTFGRQAVFTYGPLGTVAFPRVGTPGTLALGILGAAVIQLALVGVLLRSLLRLLPWPAAVGITFVGASITITSGLPPLAEIAFGLVAYTFVEPPARMERAARTLAFVGGALVALALLIKFDDGIATALIIAFGLIGLVNVRRNLTRGLVAFVATVLIAWLALGQSLSTLPDYVVRGAAVSEGYVDAMGNNALGASGQWEVLVVIAFGVALAVAAWVSLVDASRLRRTALAGCVVVVFYFVAREMFVRYDAGHALAMALLVAVPLLIPWRRGQWSFGAVTAMGLAASSLALLGSLGIPLNNVFDPGGHASGFVNDVGTMFSPASAIESARAQIRAQAGVSPQIVADFNGRCVDAEPAAIAVIFAYPGWSWCPVGVLQSYAAYTPQLDNLDAAGYADARDGPDRVLRQTNATIDGRLSTWDSPAAMLSLFCHFTEIASTVQWQALERIPDRCGQPRQIASIHTNALDVADMPTAPPGSMLVAKIYGLQIHHLERFETLFVRAGARTLVINGTSNYRVVPDTLEDGLVLDVPAYADYPVPFNYNLSVRTIEGEIDGKPLPMTVKLLSIPIKRISVGAFARQPRTASGHRRAR